MKTFRFVVWLVMLGIIPQAQSCAAAAVDDGWEALLQNDVTTAETILRDCVKENPEDLDARDGLAVALWTRGDMPEAANVWMELARRGTSRAWWDGYLAALSLPELQGIEPERRAKFLKQLSSNPSLSADQQRLVWREVLEWAEKRGDLLQTRSAAERDGVISDWWFALGPFGTYGTMDLWEPFPPEKDLSPSSFPGWISTVSRREIPEVDPAGKLDLESLIYPSEGTVYAFTAVESEDEAEALLIAESPANYIVWWDGRPVLMRCLERRDFFTEGTAEVHLRKGITPLLVKSCRREPDWWVRLRLHPVPGGTLPKWRVAKQDKSLLSKVISLPMSKRLAERQTVDFKWENRRHAVLDALYAAVRDFRKANFSTARERLSPALEAGVAQAYVVLGDLRMREAARRGASRSRLQREAETAYRRAAGLCPEALGAHIGVVSYFLERDNVDRALEYLKPIAAQLAQERIHYRAGIDYALGLLYYRKHWLDESLAALRRSVEVLPPSAEPFRRIASIQSDWGDRVGALETLKRGLAVFPHHSGLADEAISHLEGGSMDRELQTCLERRTEMHPYRPDDQLRMAQAWRFSGDSKRAREICQQLSERYPERPEPVRELARIIAAEDTSHISDEAADLYRRVLSIAPHDDEARKTLRHVGPSEDQLIERYDVRLEDLDLSQADRWKESRAPDIYLIDGMVMIIDRQGTHRQYVHQAVKVLNKEGRERWAETVIPKGSNVEIRMARSILPDGTEWPVEHVADLRDQQALSMYGVDDGTIIEYAYLNSMSGNLRPGANSFTGGYFFGAIDEPMLVSKLAIIIPQDMEFLLEVKPKKFGTRENLEDGRVALVWENRLQDGVRRESFMPPVAEVVPCLRFSTWTDWRIGLELWHEEFLGRFEDGPELEKIVQQFSGHEKDRTALVRQVYDWIQKEIEPAGGAYTTLDTAVLRAGSGWEKDLLAHHILRRLGFRTAPGVVVKNRPDDGFSPLPIGGFSGPSLLRIDLGEEKPTWFDFSSRHIAAGEIDGEKGGGVALVLDEEGEYFEPVDPAVWPRGWIERQLELHPNADRTAGAEGSYTYRGTHRRSLLSLIVDKEAERRFKDSQVSGDLRGIQLETTELVHVDSPYGVPQLRFSGRIRDFLQPGEGDALRLPGVPSRLDMSNLVEEVTRETPVKFTSPPVTEPLELHVDLRPMREAGYTLVDLPDDYICLAPYGYYSVTYRRDGDKVTVRRSVLIPEQTIETRDYGNFAAFCRRIDEAERRDILFARDKLREWHRHGR
jgi:tetratricopeptide (TPR) repeat protein